MKVTCQKCSATYAIHDRSVTAQGVRAQCPRCQHVQGVRREAPDAAAAPPGGSPPSPGASAALPTSIPPLPRAVPPAPPTLAPGVSQAAPPGPSSPPAPVRAAEPARSSSLADELFSDFGTPAPAPAAPVKKEEPPAARPGKPAASAPNEADPFQGLLESPHAACQTMHSAVPAAAPASRTRAPGKASDEELSSPSSTCGECGKGLSDPFDQAMGTCTACRVRTQGSASSSVNEPSEESSVDIIDVAPLTPPRGAQVEEPSEPRSAARSRPRAAAAPAPAQSAARKRSRSLLPIISLGVGLVGGGAAFLLIPGLEDMILEDLVGEARPHGIASTRATLPDALQAVLPAWRSIHGNVTGSGGRHLEQGTEQLAKGQHAGYLAAEVDFQRALLMNPDNDAAISGYALALALGRGAGMEDRVFQEALGLIEAAQTRSGPQPELLLAHANLLLARPLPEHLEQARKLAEAVLDKGTDAQQAEAHLVLGRAFLFSSKELAHQHFDSALALKPELEQRVHYHRALAHEAAGSYTRALAEFERRLAQDPEHWDSLAAMARIFVEVGEVARARKLYEARLKEHPGELRVLLSLAMLRYQVEGSAAGAASSLRALLRHREKYTEHEVAELLMHLAAAERLAGNPDAAMKAAREALGLVQELPAAHLQLFLTSLARGDAAAAAGHLAPLRGRLGDAALEKMLEGRLRMSERKPSEAMERFLEASQLDARRVDALLLAGVAAAQAGRREESFRLLFQVLQADPLRLAPQRSPSPLHVRPGELLRGTEGAILALAKESVDVMPRLYEGLLRFHQGDAAGAERLLGEVSEVDGNNAAAFAYRALIALDRKKEAVARTHATRAVAVGRQVAVAHLAQGLVLAATRQVEPAKRALRDTLALAPSLLAAEVKLAELESSSDRDSARARLLKVVGIDPSYRAAKRVLFLLDRRG